MKGIFYLQGGPGTASRNRNVGESSNDEAVVVPVLRLQPNTAASDGVAREDGLGLGSDEGIVAVETDHAKSGGISSVPVLDVTVVEIGADGVEVELVKEVGLVIGLAQGPGGGLGSAGEGQGGTERSKRRGHVGCWKVNTETENVSKGTSNVSCENERGDVSTRQLDEP